MGEVKIDLNQPPPDLPIGDDLFKTLLGHWADHWDRVPRMQYWNISDGKQRMEGDDNLCGAQQRCFELYWALRECTLKGQLGLSVGSSTSIPPSSIGIDKYCGEHPNYPEWGYPTMQCCGEDLSVFFNEQFNAVLSNHSFEHLLNPTETLMGWYRVLKPGGVVAMVVPDCRFGSWNIDPDHKFPYYPEKMVNIFRGTELDWTIEEMDSLQNDFSFSFVARKP